VEALKVSLKIDGIITATFCCTEKCSATTFAMQVSFQWTRKAPSPFVSLISGENE